MIDHDYGFWISHKQNMINRKEKGSFSHPFSDLQAPEEVKTLGDEFEKLKVSTFSQ
jgi:hypothetical protein